MHPLLDVRTWPRVVLRNPLLMLTAILLGAGAGFAYSYAPLHRAKDWQIEYLEGRLQARTEQVETLDQELASARGSLEDQPSAEQLSSTRAQLGESQELRKALEKELRGLEKKLQKAERSRDSWRKKHAGLSKEIEGLRKPEPAPASPAPEPPAGGEPLAEAPEPSAGEEAAAPAAPAPGSGPTPAP